MSNRDGVNQYVWLDRWTGNFMRSESYPAVWDEMKTEGYKPIIVWWDE